MRAQILALTPAVSARHEESVHQLTVGRGCQQGLLHSVVNYMGLQPPWHNSVTKTLWISPVIVLLCCMYCISAWVLVSSIADNCSSV